MQRIARLALYAVLGWWALCALLLVAYRFADPPTTGVQIQRRIGSWFEPGDYTKRQRWKRLDAFPAFVPRAVVAAEDARFFKHRGFDWVEVGKAGEQARRRNRPRRGASTITQQLVKNLFFTTHRSPVRKVYEWTLTPVAELALGKQRILELYVNVIEWGPGVYGIESAAQYHYRVPAARLSREQAARLAAIVPAPLRRNPRRMGSYAGIIMTRMRQMGW